jgi:predicted metalloprotease with PDZ domain
MGGYGEMAKDQGLGNMFGPQQRYAMLKDVAKLKGFTNFAAYLDPKAPPPQPDPFKTRELDIKDKTAQAALMAVQVKQNSDNRLFANAQAKIEQTAADLHVKALDMDRTNDRQDAETTARIQQGEEQMEIEREKIAAQERAANRAAAVAAIKARSKPATSGQ